MLLSFLSLNAEAPSENPDQSLDMNKSHDVVDVGPKPPLALKIKGFKFLPGLRLEDFKVIIASRYRYLYLLTLPRSKVAMSMLSIVD